MFFYQQYFSFLQKINQDSNNKPEDSQELASIENLLSLIEAPKRVIAFNEIVYFLHELQLIANYFEDEESIPEDLQNLEDLFCNEVVEQFESQLRESPWLLTNNWVDCNTYLCEKINAKILHVGSSIAETNRQGHFFYDNQLGLIFINFEEQFNLIRQILRAAVLLGVTPPLTWYASRPELKTYESTDVLVNLAFTQLNTFQCVHEDFPGFLAYKVRNYQELSSFCQLLPLSFYFLLTASQVRQYVPDVVHFVKIVEQTSGLDRIHRMRVMQELINTLDDLVAVTNYYPAYVKLIGHHKINYVDGSAVTKESPCCQLIRTVRDLYRLPLGTLKLLHIIKQIDRLRSMVDNSDDFVEECLNRLTPVSLPNKTAHTRSNANGFFHNTIPASVPKAFDNRILSLGQIVNMLQFDREVGYYSSGVITFSDETENGDFSTQASSGYGLAIALGFRAFQVWHALRMQDNNQGTSYVKSAFEILECGAGNGMLCLKIFDFINRMATAFDEWKKFAALVHYTIIEISPALAERQKKALADLITQKKVEVVCGDVLNTTVYNKQATLHISNELMDMLPSEEIIISESNQPQVVMKVPMLTEHAYHYFKKHHPQSIDGLAQESQAFILSLKEQNIDVSESGYALTTQRFKNILKISTAKDYQGPVTCFNYYTFYNSITLFPEIQQYLSNNTDVLVGMQPGDSKIICPALATYSKFITQKSLVSIVIDYGDITFNLINSPYRSYGGSEEDYKPLFLCHPGKRDITYDVDFTALVHSVKQLSPSCKMNLVFTNALLPEEFMMPDSMRLIFSEDEEEAFRQEKFIAASYVAPELAPVKFHDLKDSFFQCVTLPQLRRYISDAAKHMVGSNTQQQSPCCGSMHT